MKKKVQFTPGKISERLIWELQNCEAKKFIKLISDGHIDLPSGDYSVTIHKLKFYSFSSYIQSTGASAYYVLHGDEPRTNRYTDIDDIVIEFISMLTTAQQIRVLNEFEKVYPKKPVFDEFKGMRISDKFRAFIKRLPHGYLARIADDHDTTIPRYEYLTEIGIEQIQRIRTSRNAGILIPTDALPYLASFLGISLHYLMELEVPLYCATQEGDCLFDCYTLLSDREKKVFVSVIKTYLEQKMAPYFAMMSRLKGDA